MKQFLIHNKAHHKSLLLLAGPMILSNITVPLLGIVDTAVIGHLGSAHYLAGIALGSAVISILFWLAGFLRMSTTGLVAQAYGQNDLTQLAALLKRSLVLSCFVAVLLIALSPLIKHAIAFLSAANSDVLTQAYQYFSIRIFSAPAALCNLVLLGWMLGMHYGRGPFYLLLVTNITNIVLDIYFVVYLDWAVAGAAWASLIADYTALVFAVVLVIKLAKKRGIKLSVPGWFSITKMTNLLSLNRDIFIRSFILQLCFSFMTFYGARIGETTLAANAVLLNFLMLVSFALDGIAYASEAKVGHAKGQQSVKNIELWVRISVFWGALFALAYSLFFAIFGRYIITLLTNVPEVITTATLYLPWIIALPLLAMSCFLFDGVFVGLTRAKAMRNSMLLSASVGFFGVFAVFHQWENNGLWLAMSCFMLMRGVTLIVKYQKLKANNQLLD
ncbi:multidrug resistance protein, MATE family [Pseudoalteromonas nigrifaciens]|uniref:Multidrug resistance protein, MATE family n=2 Tax=Pseudoalteromonas TaxID=53246 RepID=A0AAC9XZ57_9GAMM|nr:multidrug resistance protein, MATE family [Pseudoalteromonas nigrifaciens]MBH0071963.1 MATE family efflux transporter [Pseudoalteromonas sp. NZS127]GEN42670.1 MATE family efflux transporter [Pseudoalteromonas nigrifaciens]|tara:strand:+ start:14501 stop:15835 length:1335 start_codon:yes stop_codon:yes gene_type:complete